MIRHGSRARRFTKNWLGLPLATLLGIGSTVELAAMPIPAAGVPLPGPTLIQQPSTERPGDAEPPAGSAHREGRSSWRDLLPGLPPSPSANESKADSFIELQKALTAARERLGELSKAAEAVAATGKLRQELAALREENQQMRAAIESARVAQADLDTAKHAAEARAAELAKTAEEAKAKAKEMDQESAAARWQSEQRIAAADAARTEAEARLSAMREDLQQAEQEKARIGADLARVQGEFASAREQAAAAGQERAQLDQRAAVLAHEADDLRTRLADVTARLGQTESAKSDLESEVAELREAARIAADDTRQLIESLAAIGLAAGPLESDAALLAKAAKPSAGEPAKDEARAAAAAAPVENAPVGAAPPTETASAARPGDQGGAHLDQRAILGGRPAVFPILADLPQEKRQHVQGLLADLHSNLDERGLMATVPGELLFTEGSDEVQVGAYDTLAKVAELMGLYENREVLIIGHSDARGDAASNTQLSERRAERVKQIFVDYFGIAADRLSTEGVGAARSIASNATPEGRRANRRVEVLILN